MWTNTFDTEPYGIRGMRFYEPLKTAAPKEALPYCCYTSTVVFCEVEQPSKELCRVEGQWNLLGQRFSLDLQGLAGVAPFVWHEDELYELGGGEVVWYDGGWHVRWLGWRVPADDRRWPFIPAKEAV